MDIARPRWSLQLSARARYTLAWLDRSLTGFKAPMPVCPQRATKGFASSARLQTRVAAARPAFSAIPFAAVVIALASTAPLAASPLVPVLSSVELEPFVGMAYAAVPEKTRNWGVACDDFMAPWSEPLWGYRGRNDLQIMRDMGVNVVHTYGIGSHLEHREFLDAASAMGLKVIPSFADYAYTGSGSMCGMNAANLPASCVHKEYNCHDTIRDHYANMLSNGYTIKGEDGKIRYHPALLLIVLANEIELKLQDGSGEVLGKDGHHARVVVSALDGLLSAEETLRIVGPRPLLTATASYATCPACKSVKQGFPGTDARTPFLPIIADYFLAFQDPQGFAGYKAQHKLMDVYRTRWVNSFNTPRPAAALCETEDRALLSYASGPVGNVPIFIGEFHHPLQTAHEFYADIIKVRRLTQRTDHAALCGKVLSPLVGFNIFEYQVSYWKGVEAEAGAAMQFGIWGLGNKTLGITRPEMAAGQRKPQQVWCLFPSMANGKVPKPGDNTTAHSVIAALGGRWPHHLKMC